MQLLVQGKTTQILLDGLAWTTIICATVTCVTIDEVKQIAGMAAKGTKVDIPSRRVAYCCRGDGRGQCDVCYTPVQSEGAADSG